MTDDVTNDAMNAAIRRTAPQPQDDEQDDVPAPVAPDFDGGARTTAPRTPDMNAQIRGKVDRWLRGE